MNRPWQTLLQLVPQLLEEPQTELWQRELRVQSEPQGQPGRKQRPDRLQP